MTYRSPVSALALWLAALGACDDPKPSVPAEMTPPSKPGAASKPSVASTPPATSEAALATRAQPAAAGAEAPSTAPAPASAAPVSAEMCADCHPKIVESFAKTGMALSLYRPEMAAVIEDYGEGKATVRHESGLVYQATVDEQGRWWQVEQFPEAGGQLREVSRVQVTHVVGSGHHTRSYLGVVGGQLVELPLTWYAHRKVWDMSPGYEGDGNFRFERPVKPDCLFCHNDLTPADPLALARYTAPLAGGITCARCHGDGAAHVARQQAGEGPPEGAADETILNPRRLPAAQQLQLCEQCHLQGEARVLGEGRRWDAYSPREPLPAFMSVFVPATDGGAAFGIAGHAQRLALSACAQGAEASGKAALVCTTCHDPHRRATAASRRGGCISCHTPRDCGDAHGGDEDADCAGCHMPKGPTSDIPHVQFTDHLIRKRPEIPSPARREGAVSLVSAWPEAPDEARLRLGLAYGQVWRFNPERGESRALAIAELEADVKAHPHRRRAWAMLARARGIQGNLLGASEAWREATADGRPGPIAHSWRLEAAEVLTSLSRHQEAEAHYKAILAIDPKHPHAWASLGNLYQRQRRHQEAEGAYAEAVKGRPHDGGIASNRGVNLMALGQLEAGLRSLTRGVELDPINGSLRYNLAAHLLMQRRGPEAMAHLNAGLALKAPFEPLWLMRAQGHLMMGAPKKGLADLDAYVKGGGILNDEGARLRRALEQAARR